MAGNKIKAETNLERFRRRNINKVMRVAAKHTNRQVASTQHGNRKKRPAKTKRLLEEIKVLYRTVRAAASAVEALKAQQPAKAKRAKKEY